MSSIILPRLFYSQPSCKVVASRGTDFLRGLRHIWLPSGNGAADMIGDAHASIQLNSTSNGKGPLGMSILGSSGSGSSIGFRTESGMANMVGATALTMFSLVSFDSTATSTECCILRRDSDSDTSCAQFALSVYPSTGVVRGLVSTTVTTGWTGTADANIGSFSVGVPYVIIWRWKAGTVVQAACGVMGDTLPAFASGGVTPTGTVTSTGSCGTTPLSVHIGGIGSYTASAFPGHIYMAGISDAYITTEEAQALARNPWLIFRVSE